MPNIGPLELVIVLVIVLLIFGPKRLPGLGRQLGSGCASSRTRSPARTRTTTTSSDEVDRRPRSGRARRARPVARRSPRCVEPARRAARTSPPRVPTPEQPLARDARVVRPIGHEERLSIVDHLDELRTRLIICVVGVRRRVRVCYWQNDRILEIVNQPLESTQTSTARSAKDPLEEPARFADRSGAARSSRRRRSRERRSTALAGRDESLAAAASRPRSPARPQLTRPPRPSSAAAAPCPTTSGRQPVTLGVDRAVRDDVHRRGLRGAAARRCRSSSGRPTPSCCRRSARRERRVALPLMAMVPVLFIAGVAFGYFVALPRAVDFLQNFNDDQFDILIQAADYYRFWSSCCW